MTDKLLPQIEEWQKRPLSEIYPVVFIDAIHYSVRDNYVADKDRKAFANDLKTIYNAPSEQAGREALDDVTEKWEEKYPPGHEALA